MKTAAFVALLLTAFTFAPPADSAARGTVVGTVIGVEYTYGPRGPVNSILLIVNADVSGHMGVLCERRYSNLNLCVQWLKEQEHLQAQGEPLANVIRTDGVYRPVLSRIGCQYFSPSAISH